MTNEDMHKIKIEPIPGRPGHDAVNLNISLDGKPLHYITGIEIKAVAGEVNRVTLDMLAEVDVDLTGETTAIIDGKKYKLQEVEE